MSIIILRRRNSIVPPAPPPPSGLVWEQNRPAGMELHSSTQYDGNWDNSTRVVLGNVTLEPQWLRTNVVSGRFGTQSAAARFPQGSIGGGVGVATIVPYEMNARAVYQCINVMLSPGYIIHSNPNTEKWDYPVFGPPYPGPAAPLNINANGSMSHIHNRIEDGGLDLLLPPGTIEIGQWMQLETYLRMNTPLVKDGIIRIWKNGVLVCDRSDQMFHNDNFFRPVGYWRFDTTRGGGADAPLPADQFRYIDRISYWRAEVI